MIRRLPNPQHVYLTFDDGPDGKSTPEVLETLDRVNAKATFFVVGRKASENSKLIQQIVRQGHSIGNHSWDHGYRPFFRSYATMKNWVREGEDRLSQLLGQRPVGFRPPAGVVTPPLLKALRELDIPMYLWSHRFFDTQFRFRRSYANLSAKLLRGGEIVLLHDAQQVRHLPIFLKTLEFYSQAIKNNGYKLATLKEG